MFLTGYAVVMVTYYVEEISMTCLPIIGDKVCYFTITLSCYKLGKRSSIDLNIKVKMLESAGHHWEPPKNYVYSPPTTSLLVNTKVIQGQFKLWIDSNFKDIIVKCFRIFLFTLTFILESKSLYVECQSIKFSKQTLWRQYRS